MRFSVQKWSIIIITTILGLFHFISCKNEKVEKEYKPTNAHESYIYSLEKAGLHKTILYKQFTQKAQDALTNAIMVPIPYSEIFYIDHTQAEAYGYRFGLKKGQKIKIKTEMASNDSVKLFVDVFRIRDSLNTSWYRVASASDSLYLEFVARRNSEYILRIQPELLCDVQCKVEIEKESSFRFPVLGKSSIQSFFGDPRDGGKRNHHGVDIFAPRHTQIIASENGFVGRTGNRGIGGKHVWVYYPSLATHCYYAHLETIDVKSGMKIKAGTKIGTVGNTGNARYTPPHLHFGIYESGIGPVDPYYFIATENKKPDMVSNRIELLWSNVRIKSEQSTLYFNNQTVKLSENTSVKVCAINTNKVKVRLPDDIMGFLSMENIEISDVLFEVNVKDGTHIYNAPKINSLIINKLKKSQKYKVLSMYNNYCMIRLKSGKIGWISKDKII